MYSIDYPLKELRNKNLVKQYNMSTIKMVKGGVRVCGARTRNIYIHYFYATKRVKDGTIVVTYCSTKKLTVDHLSKPLQDNFVCLHQHTLMGITSELANQYQMEYVAAKVAQAKLTHDHLLG